MIDEKKIRFFRFGDLKAIRRTYAGGLYWWFCEYKCGNTRAVEQKRLLAGSITSCVPCEPEVLSSAKGG